jgi:hypothetical protein
MIHAIPDYEIRHAIEVLTNMESRKRTSIYELLKSMRIDDRKLLMLNENTSNGDENKDGNKDGQKQNGVV